MLMYPGIYHTSFRGFVPKGVLLVIALKVVQAVDTLLVEYDQPFVCRPSELDDFALVPLQ